MPDGPLSADAQATQGPRASGPGASFGGGPRWFPAGQPAVPQLVHAIAPRLSGWRGGLWLALVALLLHAPGLWSVPPVDRDESRFAQASAQMLASHSLRGWVVPMVGDKPRLNKPPLIYWLQAASAGLAGVDAPVDEPSSAQPAAPSASPPHAGQAPLPTGDIGWFRVPSVLSALGATLITWRLGLLMFGASAAGRVTAWLAGLLLASSVMVMWDARQARADQLLLLTTTGAMWALWACWRAPSLRRAACLWVCIGLGVMSKGPITPMIAGLTVLTLCIASGSWRWARSLRPALGLIIVALCVLPWAGLVMYEVGASEYLRIVFDETLGRSASAKEGHWGPPGYHAVLFPLMFWPGSLLTAAGLALAWRAARPDPQDPSLVARHSVPGPDPARSAPRRWLARFRNAEPASLFLLAWIAPSWIVFELVGTKLPHYTMPLYPALALLSARAVVAAAGVGGPAALGLTARGPRLGFALWWLLGVGVCLGAPLALLWAFGGRSTLVSSAPPLAIVACLGAAASLAAASLWRGMLARAQLVGVCSALLASILLFGFVLPERRGLWVSSQLMAHINELDPREQAPIAAIGYQEDSLQFLTRGRLRRIGPDALPAWWIANPTGLVVMPHELLETLTQAGTFGQPALAELARVQGFNYSKGDPVDLVLAGSQTRANPPQRRPEVTGLITPP